MKQHYHACLVDQSGQCFEWDSKNGKAFGLANPNLLRYAQAFFAMKSPSLGFYFQVQQVWYFVNLTRHRDNFVLLQAEKTELPHQLSEREFQILTLISHGLSNADIAENLFISNRTVAKHIEHIFEKTGINNRTLLAIFATQHNLCCLPLPSTLTQSILPTFELAQIANNLPTQQAVQTTPFSAKSGLKSSPKSAPITIGIPFVESGIGQIDTAELLNGAELAVKMINRNGGIQGRELQIVKSPYQVEDKQSIIAAYQSLFDQEVEAICTNYACYLPEVHEIVAAEGIFARC